MNIILYTHNSYNIDILETHLKELGHSIFKFDCEFENFTIDSSLASKLISSININKANAVLSFNFYPFLSLVCDVCKIHYYSWVYDSPHSTLYSKAIFSPYNHIGIFDRAMSDFLSDVGLPNTFHLPLAADPNVMAKRILKASPKFIAKSGEPDVSFVGSLYTDSDKVNLYNSFKKDDLARSSNAASWASMDDIVNKYIFNSTNEFSASDLDAVVNFFTPLMQKNNLLLGNDYLDVTDLIIKEGIIEKKITSCERTLLVEKLAKLACENNIDFRLYTSSDVSDIPNISNCVRKPIGYKDEMPYIFNKSKINLNLTLRSIHTGIPLRALDIMASGGFLLSNPQDELLEFFTIGEHFDTFTCPEECEEKILYYLNNDHIRKKIASNGLEAVKKNFTYEQQLSKLFAT